MKRVLIFSTSIFAFINTINGIPSTDKSYISEYNIVEFEKDTQICTIKFNHPLAYRKITGSGEFVDFVNTSKIWVDKSLLAETVVNAPDRVILITAPRKWGKTLNLNMLKCILEDASKVASPDVEFVRHFFKEKVIYSEKNLGTLLCTPLITQKADFMAKYFQNYPVIYLDFSGMDLENWRDGFKLCVSEVYQEHQYLMNHWDCVASNRSENLRVQKVAQKLAERFFQYMMMKFDDDDSLQSSIEWLCQNLYEVYGKFCFVLIDEFDALQNDVIFYNAASYETGTNAIEFMRNFLSTTFKDPRNSCVEKAVLTGIMRSAKATMLSGLNNILEYCDVNLANMQQFTPFYGFTPHEVVTIIKQETPDSYQQYFQEATTWYDGYGSLCLWNGSMFNPWAIMRYIEKFEPKAYWEQTGSIDILIKLLNYDFVEEIMYDVLNSNNGFNITATSLQNVDEPLLKEIHELITNAESANWYQYTRSKAIDSIDHAILSFLCQAGYLTVQSNSSITSLREISAGSRKVTIVVPNLKLREVLQTVRINSIRARYPKEYLNAVSASVDAFTDWFGLDVDKSEKMFQDAAFKKFETELKNLFENCAHFANLKLPKFKLMTGEALRDYQHLNEAAVRRTIAPVLEEFRARTKSTFLEEYGTAARTLDTQVLQDDKLLIIEYKSDASFSLDEILNQAKGYPSIVRKHFPGQTYKWVKFLAINCYLLANSDNVKLEVEHKGMSWQDFIDYDERKQKENTPSQTTEKDQTDKTLNDMDNPSGVQETSEKCATVSYRKESLTRPAITTDTSIPERGRPTSDHPPAKRRRRRP